MPGRELHDPPQQRFGIGQLLVFLPVELRQDAQRVHVVRVLAHRGTQRLEGLVLATGAQVVERERHFATPAVAIEELLESRVRLAPAAERRERLAELLVRQRQTRLEADRPSKQGTASSKRRCSASTLPRSSCRCGNSGLSAMAWRTTCSASA